MSDGTKMRCSGRSEWQAPVQDTPPLSLISTTRPVSTVPGWRDTASVPLRDSSWLWRSGGGGIGGDDRGGGATHCTAANATRWTVEGNSAAGIARWRSKHHGTWRRTVFRVAMLRAALDMRYDHHPPVPLSVRHHTTRSRGRGRIRMRARARVAADPGREQRRMGARRPCHFLVVVVQAGRGVSKLLACDGAHPRRYIGHH